MNTRESIYPGRFFAVLLVKIPFCNILRRQMTANKKSPELDVAVLGAGLMGCCLALELSRRGFRVDLIDRAANPMMGASLHNEGKLHLGFVYANDPMKTTHGLMLRGSFAFSRIIEELTGVGPSAYTGARPFHYFVPVNSQLDLSTIQVHFDRVEYAIQETMRCSKDTYLGNRYGCFHQANSVFDHKRIFSGSNTQGSIRTEERSVSTDAVAGIIRRSIELDSNVRFVGNTEIMAATRLSGGGVEVEVTHRGARSIRSFPAVANCLWDDRIRVDQSAGIVTKGPWLFRYKATIRMAVPKPGYPRIPSATGILGTYGDVVNHGDGSYYLSWYPECKQGQTQSVEGRSLHSVHHKGVLKSGIRKVASLFPGLSDFLASVGHARLVESSLRGMTAYIPGMEDLLGHVGTSKVGGGVIFALGSTDIDDKHSHLHRRSEIGPVSHGSYVTVDTGKYCMAPMFALQAADLLVKEL